MRNIYFLVDLSARLPYGVILNCCNLVGESYILLIVTDFVNNDYNLEEVKPCLYPLSSMTEEQLFEVSQIIGIGWEINTSFISLITSEAIFRRLSFLELDALFQWLNANHFDYRGLLEKCLAIDCTNLNIEYGNK